MFITSKNLKSSQLFSLIFSRKFHEMTESGNELLNGLEKMDGGKVSVFSDERTNGFMNQNGDDGPDSFLLDIDSFSQGFDRDITSNSRFIVQKSLSRKGSPHCVEKKTSLSAITNVKDAIVTTCSPRAGLGGNSTPVSPVVMAVGSVNHLSSNHPQAHQHQITITNGNIKINAESKGGLQRYSFRRSSPSFGFNPRKILFFFATLSSIGTIILIYFTLSMRKLNDGDGTLN